MTDQERLTMEARLQELLFTMKIPHWRADQKDWGRTFGGPPVTKSQGLISLAFIFI